MDITIRNETIEDYRAIKKVDDKTFGREEESVLIERLRKKNGYIPELSLLALTGNKIIGHLLLFPVKIISMDRQFNVLSLAPMAVIPAQQNKGVGSALIREGIKKATKLGYESVIVLGHPGYYPRFGFQPASKWKISANFEYPDEAFMALELKENSLQDKVGIVEFPEEYIDVK